jgi:hypothetical protein
VHTAKLGSKKTAAEGVKKVIPEWDDLIEEAEAWNYGKEMKQQEKDIAFLQFAIQDVKSFF